MRRKIAVGMPLSWPYVPSMFLSSWTTMLGEALGSFDVELLVSNASLIETMREKIADLFLERECDYLIWLDADQVYPPNTLTRLVEHLDNGLEVVGGVTPFKNDGEPMVWFEDEPTGLWRRARNFVVNRGLVQIEAMGFGGIAMKKSVLEKIQKPYFQRVMNKTGTHLIGEDLAFYKRCKDKGIAVWCDTDLIFKHIISYAIGLSDPIFWVKQEE